MFLADLDLLRSPRTGGPLNLTGVWERDAASGELLLAQLDDGRDRYLVYEGIAILTPPGHLASRLATRILAHCRARGSRDLERLLGQLDPRLLHLRGPAPSRTLDAFLQAWLPPPPGAVHDLLRRLAAAVVQRPLGFPRTGRPWLRLAERVRRHEATPSHRGYARWRTSLTSYYAALPLLPLLRGERILDLGSGLGHLSYLSHLARPGVRHVRVDRSLLALLAGRRFLDASPPDLGLVCDASQGLPLADGCIDSVLSCDALHFLDDQERCVDAVRRVLSPAGQVVLCCLRERSHPRARAIGTAHFRDRAGYLRLLTPLATGTSIWWDEAVLAASCLQGCAAPASAPCPTPGAAAWSFARLGAEGAPRWTPPSLGGGSWRVNPVYDVAHRGQELELTRRRDLARLPTPDLVLDVMPARCTLPAVEPDERVRDAVRRQILQPMAPRVSAPDRYWRSA